MDKIERQKKQMERWTKGQVDRRTEGQYHEKKEQKDCGRNYKKKIKVYKSRKDFLIVLNPFLDSKKEDTKSRSNKEDTKYRGIKEDTKYVWYEKIKRQKK